MNNSNFDTCKHNWEFHIGVDKCGGPAAGNSVYMCTICKHLITLKEKVALDTEEYTMKSLQNQEQSLTNAKVATYIAAGALILTSILYILELIK